MKLLMLIALFMVCIASLAAADAIVLPAGTAIVDPSGLRTTLDAPRFLLTRSDMETAVLAQETVVIRDRQIKDLTDLHTRTVSTATFITVMALLFGVAVGLLVHG